MIELSVVRRYARALFATAERAGVIEQVEQDLQAVDDALRANPQLQRVLRAPTIAGGRKRDLVNRVFGEGVSTLTLRFLLLVVERRREAILAAVYPEFVRLANASRNLLPVQVTSAVALTEQEQERLNGALAQRTGKRIVLEAAVEPELLGGMIVRMGDTIIDGSVRTKLEQLRHHLASGRA